MPMFVLFPFTPVTNQNLILLPGHGYSTSPRGHKAYLHRSYTAPRGDW